MRDKQAAPAASRRLWRSERYPLLRTTRVLGPPRYAVVIGMDDADGARRVMQHRLADGAERHSPDAAAAAGAHHEHLGAVRSRKQRVAGRAVDDLPVDGHLGMLLLAARLPRRRIRLPPETPWIRPRQPRPGREYSRRPTASDRAPPLPVRAHMRRPAS